MVIYVWEWFLPRMSSCELFSTHCVYCITIAHWIKWNDERRRRWRRWTMMAASASYVLAKCGFSFNLVNRKKNNNRLYWCGEFASSECARLGKNTDRKTQHFHQNGTERERKRERQMKRGGERRRVSVTENRSLIVSHALWNGSENK